ncbi:hypothetical protein [Pseudomonas fluorescens]
MIPTVLATAVIFSVFWIVMRLGRKDTRGWWTRDYFAKVAFYVAIFMAMVVGRQFDFPSRLVLAFPAALIMSVLIASPLTVIYYIRVVKKKHHLVPKDGGRVD